MVGRLWTMMALASVVAMAPRAGAFSMGEVTATTGMQGTLARSGTTNAAGTIGSVKNALGAAAATKQAQIQSTIDSVKSQIQSMSGMLSSALDGL